MDARISVDAFATGRLPAVVDPDVLVATHGKFVKQIAMGIHYRVSSSIPVEDLVQIGHIALIEAARSFVDRGVAAFKTYATVRIRGAMIDELRRSSTVSRDASRRRREFEAVRQRLQGSLGRTPSAVEMAEHVNMAVGAYRAAVDAMQGIRHESIDDAYSDDSAWFADLSPDAGDILEQTRARADVATAIATLPEREQLVLQLYFVEKLTLDDIGKALDIGGARVCQIKRKALEQLRRNLTGWAD
jgi:RNA polymerase sigma factor FliA